MSSAEPPPWEPAATPSDPLPRAEDEPAPADPPATPAPRSPTGGDVAGEYEPL